MMDILTCTLAFLLGLLLAIALLFVKPTLNNYAHPLIPEHYTLPAGHSTYLQQRVTEHGVYYVLSCENEEGEEYLSIKSANLNELQAIKNKMENK